MIKSLTVAILLCSTILSVQLFGQNNAGFITDVIQTSEMTSINLKSEYNTYTLEIAGPRGYYFKQAFQSIENIELANTGINKKNFADGFYTVQITPHLTLPAALKSELMALRRNGELAVATEKLKAAGYGKTIEKFHYSFSIKGGNFVLPATEIGDKQLTFADGTERDLNLKLLPDPSVRAAPVKLLASNHTTALPIDQVILDDLIVDGSICVGQDCVNGESFGFDTYRAKENNLRIHFQDTSNSASFPGNDWRLKANDSFNGGGNYFGIEDADAGNDPLRIDAGAVNNALRVNSNSDIGFGTATPVLELHLVDDDSPSLRLEQDGSAGFDPQVWDIVGNETNFMIRDNTDGSKLSLRIEAGAPSNSFYMDANGNVALGAQLPMEKLHVEAGNALLNNTTATELIYQKNAMDRFRAIVNNEAESGGNMGSNYNINRYDDNGNFIATAFAIDRASGTTSITGSDDQVALRVNGTAVKAGGGQWLSIADSRLQEQVTPYTKGLSAILNINPVQYKHAKTIGLNTDQTFIGVVAQEMQAIEPATVTATQLQTTEKTTEDVLTFDGTAVTYMLVNAVKEQQEMIAQQDAEITNLKTQLSELEELKKQVSALTQLVQAKK